MFSQSSLLNIDNPLLPLTLLDVSSKSFAVWVSMNIVPSSSSYVILRLLGAKIIFFTDSK